MERKRLFDMLLGLAEGSPLILLHSSSTLPKGKSKKLLKPFMSTLGSLRLTWDDLLPWTNFANLLSFGLY
jgi:hypothetical protein